MHRNARTLSHLIFNSDPVNEDRSCRFVAHEKQGTGSAGDIGIPKWTVR
jgi:hypothetical protein